ncbi:MAG: isopeptide-forming domain-containing fimbrial protein [Oscillospiraceae bacterium]|nr:isopeptide-forming domain-containing fimbrial protein [Oscillospiraceae bacterium]
MKAMQKLISILVVAALVLTMSVAVFADATTPHTITVTNPDANDTHTYSAYQVFAGNYDDVSGALSNVSWGSGVNGLALLQALRDEIPAFADCETAAQVVKVLVDFADNSEELREFAAVVDRFITTPADTADADAENPAVLNVTGDGYYYVKDESTNLAQDTYSDYILLVEGDVTVEAKDTTGVTSEKKVKDINDSTLEGSDWQDSADYDIGDPVPFKLSGTVSEDYDKYNTYKLIFHDVESEGLTFDHITGVYVDGVEITEGYTLVTNPTDGCTFEVVFEDLKTIESVVAGSVISVEYESILNENAVIGEPGNPNVMYMEYSNNPTDETSTGTTPEDKVVVFTYEVVVEKVDENGNPLSGAEFTLEKWIPDTEEGALPENFGNEEYGHWEEVPGGVVGGTTEDGEGRIIRINGKLVTEYTDPATGDLYYKIRDKATEDASETDIYLKASEVDAVASAVSNGMTLGVPYYELKNGVISRVAGNFSYSIRSIEREVTGGTTFSWNGVDDGHYRITETVTPPGYNTLDPVEFDIVAEHETESQDPQLIDVNGNPFMPKEGENEGILYGTIVNQSGGVLPSTGGIGTTLFYVLGGMLVLGAGVLMVVKKFSDVK